MLEQLILKQITLFNLESKFNKLKNGLEKVRIAVAIKNLKGEINK